MVSLGGGDIRLERGIGGDLGNITSYGSGFMFGWGWTQNGSHVFDNSHFV